MNRLSALLAAAIVAGGATVAFAQSGPAPGDAHPPGALFRGGIPPAAAAMRRGDDMAPIETFRSRRVSAPQEFGNNPTPTRNDPAGTRTQCRGGC